jgi:SAM-dependent methyltransferase
MSHASFRRSFIARLSMIFYAAAIATSHAWAESRTPDVRYEPTPNEVVDEMLQLGRVTAADTVYDLGCGDGRIVIAAARMGARGVCVDIDPQRIAESRDNARAAGVSGRIDFRNEDLFKSDIGQATVVMLFLSQDMNLLLRKKLLAELKPGTRIVSHYHRMGTWWPQETVRVKAAGEWRERPLYFWTVPQS